MTSVFDKSLTIDHKVNRALNTLVWKFYIIRAETDSNMRSLHFKVIVANFQESKTSNET